MQTPAPREQHHWLMQLVGDWEYEHQCQMGPDRPPMVMTGRQRTRALGELWILTEISGAMADGSTADSVITLGYDPARELFVGTFVSSCMTHLWPYEGTLDPSRRILTLCSRGPSFAGDGTMAQYQDIIEIADHDHHTMSSRLLGPDGKWAGFMVGRYRRAGQSGQEQGG